MAARQILDTFMRSCFSSMTPADGLHVLKDFCKDKSRMGCNAEYLAADQNLKIAIEATRSASQLRQNYRLNRDYLDYNKIAVTQRERLWEQAVFQQWHYSHEEQSSVLGCWDFLISYQVPLFAEQKKGAWGYIDLLGISRKGIPSVIEFKKEPGIVNGNTEGSESPLRIVIEAAAYAVSLQSNWAVFKRELDELQKSLGKELPFAILPEVPQVQLVGAAPASYWLDWLPVTAKGRSNALTSDDWQHFSNLLDALQDVGLPVSFVSMSGDPSDPQKLAAQPLVGFPGCCVNQLK